MDIDWKHAYLAALKSPAINGKTSAETAEFCAAVADKMVRLGRRGLSEVIATQLELANIAQAEGRFEHACQFLRKAVRETLDEFGVEDRRMLLDGPCCYPSHQLAEE